MSGPGPTHLPSPRPDDASGFWLREPDSIDLNDIAAWLAEPDINQWFDFGQGRQTLPALAVQLMLQSGRHRLRVFGPSGHESASGLVAISDVTHSFGTGSFWVMRNGRRPSSRDMTFLASRTHLWNTFESDRLHCITAWAVDCNARSRHLLERIGFRPVGLQRDCHVIRGTHFSRVLYDLLPDELAHGVSTCSGDT